MPAEYEPTDAQRSLVENAAAFGLTGAGFVQYFDSRLAYMKAVYRITRARPLFE